MISGEKVGVGIITCDRIDMFNKCWKSLSKNEDLDEIVIVNDGVGGGYRYVTQPHNIIQHYPTHQGVAKSKNDALQYLLSEGCDHIFLIEDDIYIKDPTAFQKYIEASKVSGIQHFNFSQHGMMNKSFDGLKTPTPRTEIDYQSTDPRTRISLYPHCVGAFSYYSRMCLEVVGLLDERYFNACEHVDHTLEIINAGMHPPFWYFADIEKSWEYLGDEEWSLTQSTISSKDNHKELVHKADQVFLEKRGCYPGQLKLASEGTVVDSLYQIKNKHGFNNRNV